MSQANAWYKNKMRVLREGRGSSCEFCKVTYSLEWAHVKPTSLSGQGRGRNARIRDIINNPDCYRLLCKPCHDTLDGILEGIE